MRPSPWPLLIATFWMTACQVYQPRVLTRPEEIASFTPDSTHPSILEIRTRSGDIYLLHTVWREGDRIGGKGEHYTPGYTLQEEGTFTIPTEDIVFLRYWASSPEGRKKLQVLGVQNLLLGIPVGCLASFLALFLLKAIFGSCPTTYTWDGHEWVLESEGFSNSIARWFEATDWDRLHVLQPDDAGRLHLLVCNEALETHEINELKLIAVRVPDTLDLWNNGDQFLPVGPATLPFEGKNKLGQSVLSQILAPDGDAYTSPDTFGLDTVTLGFLWLTAKHEQPVLALRYRSTLWTTTLFYGLLDLLGSEAQSWLQSLNKNPVAALSVWQWYQQLSGATVEVKGTRGWQRVGRIADAGPIAWKESALPLPNEAVQAGTLWVRLIFTTGAWALDYLALHPGYPNAIQETRILQPIEILASEDSLVPPELLNVLNTQDDAYLVLYPTQQYHLVFQAPPASPGSQWVYILKIRGYYTEWLREEWLPSTQEDIVTAYHLLQDPSKARAYFQGIWAQKRAWMPKAFWRSRLNPPVP